MQAALIGVVCLLAIVVFVMFGALVEMYEQLRQVRDHLQMVDTPTPLELDVTGAVPSAIGLPAPLDNTTDAVVLFLSERCETCYRIAESLSGGALPARLWLVVVPTTGGDGHGFVERFELAGERIMVDKDERIVQRLGLETSPAAITVRDGRLDSALTVPTLRQLLGLLSERTRERRSSSKAPDPAGGPERSNAGVMEKAGRTQEG